MRNFLYFCYFLYINETTELYICEIEQTTQKLDIVETLGDGYKEKKPITYDDLTKDFNLLLHRIQEY